MGRCFATCTLEVNNATVISSVISPCHFKKTTATQILQVSGAKLPIIDRIHSADYPVEWPDVIKVSPSNSKINWRQIRSVKWGQKATINITPSYLFIMKEKNWQAINFWRKMKLHRKYGLVFSGKWKRIWNSNQPFLRNRFRLLMLNTLLRFVLSLPAYNVILLVDLIQYFWLLCPFKFRRQCVLYFSVQRCNEMSSSETVEWWITMEILSASGMNLNLKLGSLLVCFSLQKGRSLVNL